MSNKLELRWAMGDQYLVDLKEEVGVHARDWIVVDGAVAVAAEDGRLDLHRQVGQQIGGRGGRRGGGLLLLLLRGRSAGSISRLRRITFISF